MLLMARDRNFIRNLSCMLTTIAPNQDIQQFERLYKSRFGVDCKPEYIKLVSDFQLSPEDAVEMMEDLAAFIDQVLDAYFSELRLPSNLPTN
jgi:hypothetical protein